MIAEEVVFSLVHARSLLQGTDYYPHPVLNTNITEWGFHKGDAESKVKLNDVLEIYE